MAETFKVRYDGGHVPARLRRWLDAHAHQFLCCDHEGGYCTPSGYAYNILTRPGWHINVSGDWLHTCIESNVADVLDVLRTVQPCYCAGECAEARAKMEADNG